MDQSFYSTVEKINRISFSGFKNVKCGELLSTILASNAKHDSKTALRAVFGAAFMWGFKLDKEDGNAVFVYSPSYYGRDEYETNFNMIVSCYKRPIVMMANRRLRVSFSRIKNLIRWFSWNSRLKKEGFERGVRYILCNHLLLAINCNQEFLSVLRHNKEIKGVLVFCDVHPVDYRIVATANSLGLKSITLQHAVYYHKTHGYEYEFSRSEYFLASSNYAVSEAKKSGYEGKNIITCGPMKYFDSEIRKLSLDTPNKKFGIALGGPQFEKENKKLLEFGTYIYNKYHLNIILRPHPALKIEDYKNTIAEGSCEIQTGDIREFASCIDFAILGNTNAFADLVTLYLPTFRFIEDGGIDFFEDIKDFKFSSEGEIDLLIENVYKYPDQVESLLESIRSVLFVNGNIKGNYTETINNILNGGKLK